MVENALNKMGGYANQASDIFSLGFRVGEASFGRLEMITNKWAGTSKKTFADVGAAFQKTLSTDFIIGEDISKRADALAAARNTVDKTKEKTGGGAAAKGADAAKKIKKSSLGSDGTEFEKMVRDLDTESLKEAERMLKELPDFVPPVTEEMQKIIDSANELNDSFDNIGNAVANSFKGMLTGAMSFRTAMKNIIGAVIDELFRLYVVQQVVGVVKGALGGLFGVPVPPGKAIGGSVGKNKPYMVGEQGPELFIPGGSGTIIPNRNLSSNGGGSNFNISVDARGSNDPAAVRAQVQQGILEAAPAIIAAAESRTISNLRRPRLGGAMQ
jgi:hypothetical protein